MCTIKMYLNTYTKNSLYYLQILINTSAMFITICLLILINSILGKDVKSFLDKIKTVDWQRYRDKSWSKIKDYSKIIGRFPCEPILKLWFVLDDKETNTLDKALIYAAIIYIVAPISFIPSYLYKLLGILDEGAAIFFVIKKVNDKVTPAIENKVKEVLEEWFGPEYFIIDSAM